MNSLVEKIKPGERKGESLVGKTLTGNVQQRNKDIDIDLDSHEFTGGKNNLAREKGEGQAWWEKS